MGLRRPYLVLVREDAPQRTHDLGEVFNGLRWIVRAGALPGACCRTISRRGRLSTSRDTAVALRRRLRGDGPRDLRALLRLAEGRVPGPMEASVEGLAHLAPIIRATHEHWDGTGYRDGLSGEEIPLASRIIHACDAWHAMTSDRPYREALGVERWIRKLEENMGKQLDPRVVLALVEVLKTHFLLPPDEIERIIGEALCLA